MADIIDLSTQSTETAYYRAVIRQYDKAAQKWVTRAKKIVKRYLDERPDGYVNSIRYNILWSNVETLKPAIYAQTPKPEVERRFLDKDPVGRVASEVLERCIAYFVAQSPFGSTMRQSRDDYLLAGRGVSWVRYVPTMRPIAGKDDDTGDGQITDDVTTGSGVPEKAEPDEEISYEDVIPDYVHWQDFGHNVARVWEEVSIVWRIVYLTREQLKKRFVKGADVPLDWVPKEYKDSATDTGKKATVYEIWDKEKRKAFWIAKSFPEYLDERDDPLQLEKFFPCSRPIYATLSTDSLIPVPDYAEYQDQAYELDELTQRIGLLQKAIKAVGVYDASQTACERMLSDGVQNTLIPVDSWAAMKEKGGLAGAVELLPMEEIAKTLLMLYDAREKVKQDLYEITGMSDIIRGANDPRSTATAEKLKSNFITLRLSERQREVQRFARNTIEIMGNIIARHFSLATLRKISGVQIFTDEEKGQIQQGIAQAKMLADAAQARGEKAGPPPQIPPEIEEKLGEPSWEQVFKLLRDEPDRCFRISIQTDSTIQADQQQEQQSATEFVTALGGFMQQVEGAAGNPIVAPFIGEVLAWAVRRYPVGRDLEGAVDQMVEKITKQAQQPQQPKPDPAMAKVQQDGQVAQAKLQSDQQAAAAKLQAEQQIETIKAHLQTQADAAKAQAQQQAEMLEADREDRRQQMEAQRQTHQAMMDAALEHFKAMLDARTKIEVAEISAGASLDAAEIAAANQATAE